MSEYEDFSEKSKQSLETSKLAFENSYYDSCVNRAYYAMFQAAVSILYKHNIRKAPNKIIGHSWVQAEFANAFINRNKKFPDLKGYLNRVQEWRDKADYSPTKINQKKAKRVLDKAQTFVDQVIKEIKNGN